MTFLPFAFEDFLKDYAIYLVYLFGSFFIISIIWGIIDFLKIDFINPFFSKYISMYDAANAIREERLRQGDNAAEVIDQMDGVYKRSSTMQYHAMFAIADYPLKVRRKDAKTWEDLTDRKPYPKYIPTKDGKSLMHDDKVVFPEVRMLKSDFKKSMRLLKEHGGK